MTAAPDQFMIDHTLGIAAQSHCRSKRGVTLWDMRTGAFRGAGFNSPPGGCPGRAVCAGTCGRRAVHAEVRALREAAVYTRHHGAGPWDLIHVELAPGPFTIDVARSADGLPIGQAPHVITGQVVACDGPSCPGCAAQILDVGFVAGVWLYLGVSRCLACRRFEDSSNEGERYKRCPECGADLTPQGVWRRYGAAEFYEVTMRGVRP